MKNTLFLIVLLIFNFCNAQNEFANHWHLADNVHVDFSLGGPFVDDNSAMSTFESAMSYSDNMGNLMFYSNLGGIVSHSYTSEGYVWNKNNEVMPNGVLPFPSASQSTVNGGFVIEDFSNPNQYHVFAVDAAESNSYDTTDHSGIRYFTVDMSLDGGLGDVIAKGQHVYGDNSHRLSEQLAITHHSNGTDYWMVSHGYSYPASDTFYTFLISAEGISEPTIQTIGSPKSDAIMEFSPNGRYLLSDNQIFNFNTVTGEFSPYFETEELVYGAEFSPDSRYLYIANSNAIYQYDLLAADVLASKTTIYTALNPDFGPKGLQLGPNCKIYVTLLDRHYFGCINYPNNPAESVDYVHYQLVHGFTGGTGIPVHNYIGSKFNCENASIQETEQDWSIYYANNSLTINGLPLTNPTHVSIYNATGQVIAQYNLDEKNTTIQLQELPVGLYIAEISSSPIRKKFIVE